MTSPRSHANLLRLLVAITALATALAWQHVDAPLEIRPGVGIVTVTGAPPGDSFSVHRDGVEIGSARANESGGAVIAGLGEGTVEVEQRRGDDLIVRRTIDIASIDTPHDIETPDLRPGVNYIRTRDGTDLSAFVTLPGPIEEGPYPTVVELSVYRMGDPGDDDDSDSDAPTTQPASAAARDLGYATVGVNVRGTGCSGGALDFLGDASAADGHDVIEAVAAQPWVRDGEVGLIGFSFGGLAALHAAATQPPSLRAVAALSIYGDAWSMFHPGGLDNRGFPVTWLDQLQTDTAPFGAEWIRERIADGDHRCRANQALHDHGADPSRGLIEARFRDEAFNETSVTTWAPDIEVPTLLTGQFQDSALGADLPMYLDWFGRSPTLRLVLTNGDHTDGVSPQIVTRLGQFLDLYVADQIPRTDPLPSDPAIASGPRPAPEAAEATDVATARQRYERSGRVELLWASGAASPTGSAGAVTSTNHDSWPPAETAAERWYLGAGGRLAPTARADGPAASFRTDGAQAEHHWTASGDLTSTSFTNVTEPASAATARWTTAEFTDGLVLAGPASVDLWLRSDRDDVDIQAVLLEVDADDRETMIQAGWIRAGFRRETERSSALVPAIDFDRNAYRRLDHTTWSKVRLEIPSFAHVVQAGSRLRLQIGTPGDGQVAWAFGPQPDGDGTVQVGQSGDEASTLVLPVSSLEIDVPPAPCGALRGQPCRSGASFPNTEIGTP